MNLLRRRSPARSLLALVLFAATLIAPGRAQSAATGSIEGRVLNTTNGAYLNNARVTVEGTTLQAFTNEFGEYRLSDVPAGAAAVRVFFTGLPSQSAQVSVGARQTVTHDFNLTNAEVAGTGTTVQLDAFVVAVVKETNASAIAVNEQRFAENLKNVVSADEFGGVTEGNIGEFLKFIPGVTLDYVGAEARTASVRGLPAENTGVNIDGNPVASTGAGVANRQFEFDQLSINNVSRVEVTKGPTPEARADAIGGTINLVSKSAFERSRPQFSYKAYVNMLHQTIQDVDYISLDKTPGPEREPTVKLKPNFEFSYIRPVTKNFGFTLTGMETNIFNRQYVSVPRWSPTSNVGTPGTVATIANPALTSYRFIDGPKVTARHSLGATLDWRFAPRDVVSVRGSWNEFDAVFRNQIYDAAIGVPATFSSTFTQSGNTAATFASNAHSVSMRRALRRTYVVSGQYRHDGPVWKFDLSGSYSNSRAYFRDMEHGWFNSTQLSRTGLQVRYADISDSIPGVISATTPAGAPVDIRALGSYNLTLVNTNPVDSINTNKNANASLSRFIDVGVPVRIKAGVDFRSVTSYADRPFRQWTFLGPDGVANNADNSAANYDLVDLHAGKIGAPYGLGRYEYVSPLKAYDLFVAHPEYFRHDDVYQVQQKVLNSRVITEEVAAQYLRFDLRLFENRLWIVSGVRYERTRDEGSGPINDLSRTYQRDAAGRLILNAGRPIKIVGDALALARLQYVERGAEVAKDYGDFYPSVNLTYNLTPDLVARASYAETLSRPNFNFIIPGTTLPDPSTTSRVITINNVELRPWTARNYDLALSFYPKGGGELSAGVFRKDIKDFFSSEDVDATPELLELYGIDQSYSTENYILRSQQNVSGATRIDGIEFSYRQPLKFLPAWARGVNVRYNVTKLKLSGDALSDFDGFIPLSQNWGISLDRPKFNVRLNWNSRGRQDRAIVSGVAEPGTREYVRARLSLDLEAEYRIGKHLGVFLGARNVTREPEIIQRYGPSTPGYARTYQRSDYGTTIATGVKGSF
jgi:TonB-dependent receptor